MFMHLNSFHSARRRVTAVIAACLIAVPALGQSPEPAGVHEAPTVKAVALEGQIEIDGRLDDVWWARGETVDGFTQRDPVEGAPPTEYTEVTVLYDVEAIYVGARLLDSSPDSIVARLGRRDALLEADRFVIYLDPYNDGRSGVYFGLNAAGTLYDGVLLNDDWDDPDWDGVWQGAVARTDEGWTAEMRIPYSQLRFYRQREYVWGINFLRVISRKQERDYLVYSPRNESGFVSRFWDLVGMQNIRPSRQLEVIPYVTSRANYDQTAEPGNPFNDGSQYSVDAGADMRLSLTPNLTMNATVNPDFGQVEVDPAVINLSDVETFFSEKRPFFIEGASLFQSFGYGGSSNNWGFNWGNPMFFYSRRVGRAPHGSLPGHDYARLPDGTRILGAAKVTGKVGGSWNIGTMQALTASELADFSTGARRFAAEVEPATYYGVYRAQKEFGDGKHGLGVLSTFNNRFFTEDRLESEMNARSFAFGMDGWTFFGPSRKWVVNGWTGISHVRGTADRMLELQQNSMHYFQRPDASHVEVDSTATTLSGWSGRVGVNKQRGRVIFNSALGVISPSFDVSDMGFQWRTDLINGHVGAGYRWPDPGRYTRSATVIGAVFGSLDFAGNTTWSGVWALGEVELLNYYGLEVRLAANPESINNRRTRGGPLTTDPPGFQANVSISSDSRKPLVFGTGVGTYQSGWTRSVDANLEAEWKPAANLSVAVSPTVSWNLEQSQWVGAFEDPVAVETFGRRYVFAELDQLTFSSSVRLNWTFSPELSFQLFAQPLVSVGDYGNYKELDRPKSYEFNVFGEGGSSYDPSTRLADPDGPGGPAAPIQIPDLNFNVASLRGTAVLRWEYRPGSTLYAVWTQQRSDSTTDPYLAFRPTFDQLWSAPMQNVFVIKLTYWLSP